MSLVSKAEPAEASARAVFPAFGQSSGGLAEGQLATPRAEAAGDNPHLAPCRNCGVLNGRSALTCWSCEAALSEAPVRPRAPRHDARVPVMTDSVPPSLHDSDQLPVLTTIVPDADSAPVALFAPPEIAPSRRSLGLLAAVGVAILVWAGGSLLLRPAPPPELDPAPAPAPTNAAAARAPAPANPSTSTESPSAVVGPAIVTTRVADPGAKFPSEALSRHDPSTVHRGGGGVAARSRLAPTSPAAAPPPATDGTARSLRRSAAAAPERALPAWIGPEPGRPPARPAGPCTPTVAALGLCAAPPAPAKE
jgi:hypothetical protein